MRVLFWVPQFLPDIGGIEIWSSHFLPAMQGRGHEFLVLASPVRRRVADIESFSGIPVVKRPFEKTLQDQDMSAIKSLLVEVSAIKRQFRPDLVHMNTSTGGAYFQLFTRGQYRAPALYSLHYANSVMSLSEDNLLSWILKASDHVAAVSLFIRDCAVSMVPDIIERSSVILNGLPLPTVAPLPLPFDPPCLVTYGRAVAEKGFDIALEALALVRRQRPGVRLVIAGDGNAVRGLMAQAARLGLQDAVEFTGWIEASKVPDLINQATLVLVPSRWEEPFGLVALEAAQMGRPVIATNAGGLGEVVAHGETGFVVARESPADMAAAILDLLADPHRLNAMGQAARIRAQSAFSFERMIDAYDALYHRLGGAAR